MHLIFVIVGHQRNIFNSENFLIYGRKRNNASSQNLLYLTGVNATTTTPTSSPTSFPSCYDGQLRLGNTSFVYNTDGTSYLQGRVEVCINETYGAICDVGWDQLDAQVACRQFGYNGKHR